VLREGEELRVVMRDGEELRVVEGEL
jgi:hypothetical protein